MKKQRAQIMIEIDLDPVEGWGHDADDHIKALQHYLERTTPHYNPTVSLISDGSEPTKVCIKGLVHAKVYNSKIYAIKAVRSAISMSLLDAKNLVEDAERGEIWLDSIDMYPNTDLDALVNGLVAAGYNAYKG